MRKLLRAIQKTSAWRRIVRGLWVPLHAALWRSFQNNRAYAFKLPGRESQSLVNQLPSTPLSRKVAKDILGLKESGMFASSKTTPQSSEEYLGFMQDVTALLPVSVRREVIRLALEDDVLPWVIGYFGFVPHLDSVMVTLNFPAAGLGEEGSKRWHRDAGDADAKQMKLFMPITSIDENNGPFYYLDKPDLPFNSYLPPDETPYEARWRRGRVPNDVVQDAGGTVHSLVGWQPGERLLIDTLTVYHKGGWCKNGERLMLDFSFRGDGYCLEKRMDMEQFLQLSHSEIASEFPSELHRYVLGFESQPKTNPLLQMAKWYLFRLNRAVFSYAYDPQNDPSD